MTFQPAEQIADAVLYEGYVLYPYRASSAKNRLRWQFGVIAPREYADREQSEPWAMQTECLVESRGATEVTVRVRFLQVQARTVEEAIDGTAGSFRPVERLCLDDRELVAWEEGVLQTIDLAGIPVADLLHKDRVEPLELPGVDSIETVRNSAGLVQARLVRKRWPIAGVLRLAAQPVDSLIKLCVCIENLTAPATPACTRDEAMRQSLVGAHTLLRVSHGEFLSLTDPPPPAAEAARSCQNQHTWPVLVGPQGSRDMVLSSPIILPDYPATAPESPGDLCDATEIDEILTLRIMTLTEEEKREARATDERARRIIDRSDALPPAAMERLHGAVRSLSDAREEHTGNGGPPEAWDFFNPPDEAPPELASVEIQGRHITRGSHVRLRPIRRADSFDIFLRDRAARVAGVYRDLEDQVHVAVTVDDDPAADLHDSIGRFFYFRPDELEPTDEASPAPAGGGSPAEEA